MAKKRAEKTAQLKVTKHNLNAVEIADLARVVGAGPACGPQGPQPPKGKPKGNQGQGGGLPDWIKYVGGAATGRYVGKGFDWAEKQLSNAFKGGRGGGGSGPACGNVIEEEIEQDLER